MFKGDNSAALYFAGLGIIECGFTIGAELWRGEISGWLILALIPIGAVLVWGTVNLGGWIDGIRRNG